MDKKYYAKLKSVEGRTTYFSFYASSRQFAVAHAKHMCNSVGWAEVLAVTPRKDLVEAQMGRMVYNLDELFKQP